MKDEHKQTKNDNVYVYSSFKKFCERFEPRSRFKSNLNLIVRLNVVLNRTVVVDSDWHFDNLCGSHLQSQSELYHISWWYYTLVIMISLVNYITMLLAMKTRNVIDALRSVHCHS